MPEAGTGQRYERPRRPRLGAQLQDGCGNLVPYGCDNGGTVVIIELNPDDVGGGCGGFQGYLYVLGEILP